jgi:ABC-type glycerol-3-phosphate transport system substrate-binding protein
MPAPTRRHRFSRREFLHVAGVAGLAAASGSLLAACQFPALLPAPAPGAPTETPDGQGGTVKWAEFYSSLTPDQEQALGINARANQDWIAGIARKFEQDHRGWQVVLEQVPYDGLDRHLAADVNAHVSHDLVFVTPQLIAHHRKLGDLLDLDPFLKTMSQSEQGDLNWNGVWRAGSPDGQAQLAIPIGLRAFGLAYNRARFQDAGIDPDHAFETLDQVADAAIKLTRPNQDVWGLGVYVGPDEATVEQLYAPLVWNFGGDIYNATTGTATLANDANVKAATWLADLALNRHAVSPAGYSGRIKPEEALATAFVKGQVAQSLGFSSHWLQALQTGGMVSGCMPPSRDCRSVSAGLMVMPSAGQAQFVTGRCLAICRTSQVPEMAFKLLQAVLHPDNLRTYPDAGLPARQSAWRVPEYSSPMYQTWLAAARAGRPMPPTPYYPELAATISGALNQILNQKADIPRTLQKAEDDWNSRYARA